MTRPYPAYRDSGVEWLGNVPAHWPVDRIKWSLRDCRNGVWGNEPADDGNDIICLRVADFDRENLSVSLEHHTIRNVDAETASSRLVQRGDLLLEKSGGGERQLVGAVVKYNHSNPAVCSNFVARIRLLESMSAEYWNYSHAALYGWRINLRSIKQTSGIQNLDQSQYFDELFVFPPHAEQQAIAAFLDREVGKIDGLVEAQRRLIALLAEKRRTVISHAVTRGLNPAAPLKPSGVDWLGDVPAHWEVCHMKRVFQEVDYGISDSLGPDGLVGVLRMGNIENGRAKVDDLKFVDDVDPSLLLREGDLLFNRTNSLDQIGKVGRVDEEPYGQLTFASYLVRLRLRVGMSTKYFAALMNAQGVLGEARARAFVAIGQCNLNPTRYGRIEIAVPPSGEQFAIVAYIDAQTARLDALSAEAERAVSLLLERRAALISAAVTGKIDVRDEAEATEAA